MTSFVIKIIAIITMFIDHVGYLIYDNISWMHIVGRISFPLFAFQIAIGYKHTKCFWKYALRLFVFALISQYPYYLFNASLNNNSFVLNVFFTLLFGLLSIFIYDYKLETKDKTLVMFSWIAKISIITCLCFISKALHFDYDICGILLILVIHIFYEFKNKMPFVLSYLAIVIVFYSKYFGVLPIQTVLLLCLFMYLPIIFMFAYNGKKGPNTKYWFYLIYPTHLLILAGVKYFLMLSSFIT